MRKSILLLGIICSMVSCLETKYFVNLDSALASINWKENTVNYIPLTKEKLESSKVLSRAYWLLANKRDSELNSYLFSLPTDTRGYYLARTLLFISTREYQKAAKTVRKIDEKEHALLKELLSIDLNYELARENKLKDYKRFLHSYQSLLDKYPDSPYLREIISIRVRYIRYNS